MIVKKITIFIAAILLLLCATHVFAQISGFDKVGTTSFSFLQVVPNAKVAAMGGVYTTIVNSSEAVFFNPAGLTMAPNAGVSVSYLDYFLDTQLSSLSMNYKYRHFGVIGIQVMYVDVGEIIETRVDHLFRDDETGAYNPGITGATFSPSAFVLGLSFARDITDKFSFGLTTKYVNEDLVAKSKSVLVFDGGVIYKSGFKSLVIGTALRNFGQEIKYYGKGYPLPQTFTIGISGYLISPDETFWINTPDQHLLFAFDLAQTRDHSQQQHIGLEYNLKNMLYLRTGYKFNHDEESYTLGFGVKFFRMQLDYSYNDFGDYLNEIHRFSLGLQIQ